MDGNKMTRSKLQPLKSSALFSCHLFSCLLLMRKKAREIPAGLIIQ